MTRNKNRFRQADLTRALKGARAAGMEVKSVKIGSDGAIQLATERENEQKTNAYEHWKAEHG